MRRIGLFGAMVLGLVVTVGWADAADAQSKAGGTQSAGALEEVTVTARRKEENAQTVPIAITAVSAETLERQDIRTTTDLSSRVPGLAMCCQRGEVQYAFIRGVPGVKGYFAEMPAVLDGQAYYFDVGNVQVLKGPQGTLFGVATNGGAILAEPRRPTRNFEAYISGAVGDYSRKQAEAAVNLPLSDALQVRAAFALSKIDGYIKDLSNGRRYGDDDYFAARLGVNFEPTESFTNYFVANWYESDAVRPPFSPHLANAGFWNAVSPAFYNTKLAPMMARQATLGLYTLVGSGIAGGPEMKREMLNVVDQATFRIGDNLSVRNILGYGRTKFFSRFDADGTPFAIYDNLVTPSPEPSSDKQWSEELQLQGKALDGRLDFTIGTFNQWFKGGTAGQPGLADLTDAFGILTGAWVKENKNQTHAIYGEGTYDLSSVAQGLSVTAGIRYTEDKVDLVQQNSVWARISPTQLLDLATIGAVPHTDFDLHAKYKKTTYRLGLQYRLNDAAMLYLTNSKGNSAGGFNLNNPRGAEEFQPESLDNFEAGIKSDWTAGGLRGRTNLSVYYGKYKDIQVSTTIRTCTNPNNNATCSFGVGISNAATGEIKGAEFELVLVPSEWFEIGGNGSWMDAKYTDYVVDPDGTGPQPVQDRGGQPFVYMPKTKFTVFASVGLPIPSTAGTLRLGADYAWQDKLITTATPSPQFYDRQDAFGTLNMNLTWRDIMGKAGLTGSIFATNLANNEKADGGFGAYTSLGLWGLSVAVPRQVGVRLRYDIR